MTQAVVGGLMIRAVLMPSTDLAAVPLADRVLASLIGIAAFLAFRQKVLPGVALGAGALALLIQLRSG